MQHSSYQDSWWCISLGRRCDAQISTEFIVIIALVLTLVLAVIAVVSDVPAAIFSGDRQRDNLAWYNAPIRVRYFTANATHGVLSLQNMMRDDVNITQIYIDGSSTGIGSLWLVPSEHGQLVFSVSERYSKVELDIQINSSFYSGNVSLSGVPYHVKQV